MIPKPLIKTEKDYENYFTDWVQEWCNEKQKSGEPFKHNLIVITAGPYRPSAVTYKSEGDTLHLDFYSALRRGFGEISNEEVQELKAIL